MAISQPRPQVRALVRDRPEGDMNDQTLLQTTGPPWIRPQSAAHVGARAHRRGPRVYVAGSRSTPRPTPSRTCCAIAPGTCAARLAEPDLGTGGVAAPGQETGGSLRRVRRPGQVRGPGRGARSPYRGPQLPPPRADEFYWCDLEGLAVETQDGMDLGRVDHLFATGANDVICVKGERERLIPFVWGDVIKDVDFAEGRILVDWDPDF